MLGELYVSSLVNYPGEVAATMFIRGCKLGCVYCYNKELCTSAEITLKNSRPNTQKQRIAEFVEKMKKLGITHLTLTGGEPLEYIDSFNLVEKSLSNYSKDDGTYYQTSFSNRYYEEEEKKALCALSAMLRDYLVYIAEEIPEIKFKLDTASSNASRFFVALLNDPDSSSLNVNDFAIGEIVNRIEHIAFDIKGFSSYRLDDVLRQGYSVARYTIEDDRETGSFVRWNTTFALNNLSKLRALAKSGGGQSGSTILTPNLKTVEHRFTAWYAPNNYGSIREFYFELLSTSGTVVENTDGHIADVLTIQKLDYEHTPYPFRDEDTAKYATTFEPKNFKKLEDFVLDNNLYARVVYKGFD